MKQVGKTSPKSAPTIETMIALYDSLVARSETFYSREPFRSNLQQRSFWSRSHEMANRIQSIVDRRSDKEETKVQIAKDAMRTRPVISAPVLAAMNQYLAIKQAHGTAAEKEIYKEMDEFAFIKRLLTCRPVVFMNSCDQYLLPGGADGAGGFESLGESLEDNILNKNDLISYQEMPYSALISMSVPTFFINEGSRGNMGQLGTCTLALRSLPCIPRDIMLHLS